MRLVTFGAKSAVEEINALGRKAAAFDADFDKIDEVIQVGNRALEFLGGLNCLVNNAGITFNKPFLKVTLEQLTNCTTSICEPSSF